MKNKKKVTIQDLLIKEGRWRTPPGKILVKYSFPKYEYAKWPGWGDLANEVQVTGTYTLWGEDK